MNPLLLAEFCKALTADILHLSGERFFSFLATSGTDVGRFVAPINMKCSTAKSTITAQNFVLIGAVM